MRFVCTFLLAFVIGATSAIGQENFAPLITENTVLFIHVDLQKADVDTLKQNWKRYSERLMQALQFEAAALRVTLSALDKDLNKVDDYIRPTFETFTETLGIKEIALIVDTELIDKDVPCIIAVPWKGKTDADLKTLLSLLPEDWHDFEDALVPINDFLLLPCEDVEGEEVFHAWLDNAKPANDGTIMQALKTLDNDDIKIAAAMTGLAREYLLDALKEAEEFPEPIINILSFIAKRVEWAAMSYPNPLLSPEVLEAMPPMKLTVKTRTAADARMLRNMLESSIDLGITAWRTAMMAIKAFDEDTPEMPQFLYEFVRGYARSCLPIVEGDKLIFLQPDFGGRFWEIYTIGITSMVLGMQAMEMSQEVARKQRIIGSEFKLYGKTVEDEDFDWKSYREKYVLVMFSSEGWRGDNEELSDMLDAYKTYHDKGLECVSVYVYIWQGDGNDEKNDRIKDIVENEEIPWTVISEPLTEKDGQPEQHETFSEIIHGGRWNLPALLMVDKEGNVLALDTKGKKLKKVLKELYDDFR